MLSISTIFLNAWHNTNIKESKAITMEKISSFLKHTTRKLNDGQLDRNMWCYIKGKKDVH
jgi:hypothetical protein